MYKYKILFGRERPSKDRINTTWAKMAPWELHRITVQNEGKGTSTERSLRNRPAWNTTVLLHPDSSWRFLSNPFAVSLTWMLDRENLGEKNILPEKKTPQREELFTRKTVSMCTHDAKAKKYIYLPNKQQRMWWREGGWKDLSAHHTLAAWIKEG